MHNKVRAQENLKKEEERRTLNSQKSEARLQRTKTKRLRDERMTEFQQKAGKKGESEFE